MTRKTKQILSLALTAVSLLLAGWIAFAVGRPLLAFLEDPEQFRLWVKAHGAWGVASYVGMVIFQVVLAVIPGEPIEIVGGYAFGFWLGSLWCGLATALGSMLVFFMVRTFGVKLVELFFPLEKIHSLQFLANDRRRDTVAFLLFLIPGTPKDLLVYVAGLTPIQWPAFFMISMVARLPSIVTSTAGGSALGTQDYKTAVAVFGITAFISVVGWLVYNQYVKRRQQKNACERENLHEI